MLPNMLGGQVGAPTRPGSQGEGVCGVAGPQQFAGLARAKGIIREAPGAALWLCLACQGCLGITVTIVRSRQWLSAGTTVSQGHLVVNQRPVRVPAQCRSSMPRPLRLPEACGPHLLSTPTGDRTGRACPWLLLVRRTHNQQLALHRRLRCVCWVCAARGVGPLCLPADAACCQRLNLHASCADWCRRPPMAAARQPHRWVLS